MTDYEDAVKFIVHVSALAKSLDGNKLTEHTIQARCEALCAKKNYGYLRIHSGQFKTLHGTHVVMGKRRTKGGATDAYPDALVFVPGRSIWVEFKRQNRAAEVIKKCSSLLLNGQADPADVTMWQVHSAARMYAAAGVIPWWQYGLSGLEDPALWINKFLMFLKDNNNTNQGEQHER